MTNNNKLKLFLILTKDHRLHLCILLIMMIFSAIFEVFSIALLLPLFDFLINGNQSNYIFSKLDYLKNLINFDSNSYLNFLIFLICFFFIIKNIFTLIYKKFSANFFVFINLYFQEKVLEKQLSQSFNFFLDKNSSEFINIFWNEIKFINSGLIQPVITIVFNIIIINFFIFFLIYTNLKVTLIVVLILLLFTFFFVNIFKKKFVYYGVERKKRNLLVLKLLKQTFEGIKELKFFNKENIFRKIIKKNLTIASNQAVSRTIISSLPLILGELFFVLAICFIILTNSNVKAILPMLGIYSIVIFRLMPHFNSLIRLYQDINYSKISTESLASFLSIRSKIIKARDNNKLIFYRSLKLKDIIFKYNQSILFDRLNLTINKNSCVGIIGNSGSGKTTLANIIAGFLEFSYGDIFLDKNKISIKNIDRYRNNFSYIQQKIFLFDENLSTNITFEYNQLKIDQKKLANIIDSLRLNELMNRLDFNDVGEYGAKLSGGQIQRIAIARALYRDSDILIFDESFSNLDHDNKKNILDIVNILKNKKTIIIISHDSYVLRSCDVIYKIKNKKIYKQS